MQDDIAAAISVASSCELDGIVKRVTALWGRGVLSGACRKVLAFTAR